MDQDQTNYRVLFSIPHQMENAALHDHICESLEVAKTILFVL